MATILEDNVIENLLNITLNSHDAEKARSMINYNHPSDVLAALKELIKTVPSNNSNHLHTLKEKLAKGQYVISSQQIAENLLA